MAALTKKLKGSTPDNKVAPKKGGTRAAPKFTHLPAQRAQKLKEEWIVKQRIKNAYRAQRRKASGPDDVLKPDSDSDHSDMDEENTRNSFAIAGPSSPASRPPKRSHISLPTQDHFPNSKEPQKGSPPITKGKNRTTLHSSEEGSEDLLARQERLHALVRDAYAPESLHTFKSDPLRKRMDTSGSIRRGIVASRGMGRGRGRGNATRGGGGERGRGRGQPDMRKRMGALLAQIEDLQRGSR